MTLDDFPVSLHPPVLPVFWGFRIMVGIGILMLLVSWAGAWFGSAQLHIGSSAIRFPWTSSPTHSRCRNRGNDGA